MLADALGSEAIHPIAWELVQSSLRQALDNPTGCASGDVAEVEKLCVGLVMSGFAMQAMNSSRPASGTEHQISHYWDMEDLCFEGRPVSHGFKVGIGTLASTKTLEFLLRFDMANLDVDAVVSLWWPDFASLASSFAKVFGARPAHIRRAELEMAGKYSTPEVLREELMLVKRIWPELSQKMKAMRKQQKKKLKLKTQMKKKRKSVRIHDRKIDRAVARKKLKDQGITLSRRYRNSFADIWRELSQ